MREPQEDYGYFDFAHIAGAVVGDLKGMRRTVLKTTQLFTYRVLFAINPSLELSHKSSFKIEISDQHRNAGFIYRLISPEEFETTWFVNKRSVGGKSVLCGCGIRA